MEKKSSAATDALLLSLVTIVYSLIGTLFEPKGFVSVILWVLKFTGILYLLYCFMKQSANLQPETSYSQSFKYGFKVSLFSSIICAGYIFLSMTLFFPGRTDAMVDQVLSNVMQDPNYESVEGSMGKVLNHLPQITLFFSLVYYIVFGLIASSIIANFTKKERDIFDEITNDRQDCGPTQK